MPGKNYYGIFTLFYEVLRGNNRISGLAFMSGVLWASLLILCYSRLCRTKRFRERVGVSGMFILYGICIVHLFIPVDTIWQRHIRIPVNSVSGFAGLPLKLPMGWPGALWRGMVLVWFFGAVIQSVHYVAGHIKTSYILDSLPKQLLGEGEVNRETIDLVPPRTKVYRCWGIQVPFSMGIIHRQILLPAKNYSMQELEHIIRHEIAHLKQFDHVTALMTDILCAVYWWNPCVYLLKRDIEQSMEIRCDREAVQGMENTELAEYMSTLISVFRDRYGTSGQKGLGLLGSGDRMRRQLRERFAVLAQGQSRIRHRNLDKIILAGFAIFMMLLANNVVISPFFPPKSDGIVPINGVDFSEMPIYTITEDTYIIRTSDGEYILMNAAGAEEINETLANAFMEEGVDFVDAMGD